MVVAAALTFPVILTNFLFFEELCRTEEPVKLLPASEKKNSTVMHFQS